METTSMVDTRRYGMQITCSSRDYHVRVTPYILKNKKKAFRIVVEIVHVDELFQWSAKSPRTGTPKRAFWLAVALDASHLPFPGAAYDTYNAGDSITKWIADGSRVSIKLPNPDVLRWPSGSACVRRSIVHAICSSEDMFFRDTLLLAGIDFDDKLAAMGIDDKLAAMGIDDKLAAMGFDDNLAANHIGECMANVVNVAGPPPVENAGEMPKPFLSGTTTDIYVFTCGTVEDVIAAVKFAAVTKAPGSAIVLSNDFVLSGHVRRVKGSSEGHVHQLLVGDDFVPLDKDGTLRCALRTHEADLEHMEFYTCHSDVWNLRLPFERMIEASPGLVFGNADLLTVANARNKKTRAGLRSLLLHAIGKAKEDDETRGSRDQKFGSDKVTVAVRTFKNDTLKEKDWRIVFFPTHNDCILVESEKHFAIIDAGQSNADLDAVVIPYLETLLAAKKELVVIVSSHPDADHIQGIPHLVSWWTKNAGIRPHVMMQPYPSPSQKTVQQKNSWIAPCRSLTQAQVLYADCCNTQALKDLGSFEVGTLKLHFEPVAGQGDRVTLEKLNRPQKEVSGYSELSNKASTVFTVEDTSAISSSKVALLVADAGFDNVYSHVQQRFELGGEQQMHYHVVQIPHHGSQSSYHARGKKLIPEETKGMLSYEHCIRVGYETSNRNPNAASEEWAKAATSEKSLQTHSTVSQNNGANPSIVVFRKGQQPAVYGVGL